MIEQWTESLVLIVESNPWMAPLAAFAGGLLTAANPCVLAMVPLMMAYVADREQPCGLGRSFLLSLMFTIGLTIMFSLLFLGVWAASATVLSSMRPYGGYITAGVCLLMGLHLLGVLNFRIPAPAAIQPAQRGVFGALLLGMLFGLVSIPCAGPILAVVLSTVPKSGPAFGATLLASYSIGHCGLVLVGGTSMGLVQRMADSQGWNRGIAYMRRGVGVLVVLVGLGVLWSS